MVLQPAKILLVDDDPAIRLTLSAILTREGYDVDSEEDGRGAVEAVRSRHYDLVLTDLKMPKLDGLGVLAEVRLRSPKTVTVMMTGYGSLDSALEAVQLGAFDYLLKPTPVPDLRAAVQRALERKQLSEVDTLYRISRAATSLDPNAIAEEVCRAARRILGIAHAELHNVRQKAAGNQRDHAGWSPEILQLLEQGEAITDADRNPEADHWARSQGLLSYALVPGITGGRLICVLVAGSAPEPYEFHASALRLLQGLAEQASLSLANAVLVSELRSNNDQLLEANAKLQELNRLKSKFLRAATHELRTPLTVVLGYNSMLAETLQDRLDEQESATLQEAVSACKRLIRMLNSMLDVSRIESGKMPIEFANADVRRLVSGAVALFQQEARKKNIRLLLELPSHLPTLSLDSHRIQQVLINLLHNALKFTPSEGRITVSVRARDDSGEVEISVADTGIGIAPNEHKRIFEEFEQASGVTRLPQDGGFGLGLAICRHIIEAHGGSIEVLSEPGRGSTFRVSLPTRKRPGMTAVSA